MENLEKEAGPSLTFIYKNVNSGQPKIAEKTLKRSIYYMYYGYSVITKKIEGGINTLYQVPSGRPSGYYLLPRINN